jgi:hypothetical protein
MVPDSLFVHSVSDFILKGKQDHRNNHFSRFLSSGILIFVCLSSQYIISQLWSMEILCDSDDPGMLPEK